MTHASPDVRALLARHLPGREVRSVAAIGQGLDNVAYEVDGELIVRCAKEPDPAATEAEVAVLAAVAPISPLPVPEVVFSDPAAGVIAYRRLPGRPLHRHPVADPRRLAEPLGAFLTALHAVPPAPLGELVPLDRYPLADLREEAAREYESVAAHVPPEHRRLVEDFLAAGPPADPFAEPRGEGPEEAPAVTAGARLCHNDLGAEHLLADPGTGRLTGVVDWTDAALTDPARDFARLYRDLGPEVYELTLARYAGRLDDAVTDRVRFLARCALIEDLAHGLGPGPRPYADAALAHLVRTFTG
ncbi:phosphotransferase family protein [Nonomuraea indica]|uniref:phosphotransferase family protein n=1 Tax=Nonomuraea indica TaxID=1581193 RepID=UPI000C79E6F1|nr:phosphotransferase [Nonomuraea indica]